MTPINTTFRSRIALHSFVWLLLLAALVACQDDGLYPADSNVEFYQNLSEYNIYVGDPEDLTPAFDYHYYDLSSSLFTDHAEKQRLIKIPAGTQMTEQGDDLPDFPDGTIMVKTFYYYKDARNWSLGKKIVETRLLIKEQGQWNVGTYLWDDNHQDARLVEGGYNRLVNFIDAEGEPQVIAYQLPNNRACASCHSVNEELSPIGPKVRNLNRAVPIGIGLVNQLEHFQSLGLLNQFDVTTKGALPDYNNENISLEERARAYLDINCAHCHDSKGTSPDLEMFYGYHLSFEDTQIEQHKEDIVRNMVEGSMPQIGTSVIDEKGAKLIQDYINSL